MFPLFLSYSILFEFFLPHSFLFCLPFCVACLLNIFIWYFGYFFFSMHWKFECFSVREIQSRKLNHNASTRIYGLQYKCLNFAKFFLRFYNYLLFNSYSFESFSLPAKTKNNRFRQFLFYFFILLFLVLKMDVFVCEQEKQNQS